MEVNDTAVMRTENKGMYTLSPFTGMQNADKQVDTS